MTLADLGITIEGHDQSAAGSLNIRRQQRTSPVCRDRPVAVDLPDHAMKVDIRA